MLQLERDLIRVQILLELYENLLCACSYDAIRRQEYRIAGNCKCEIVASLFYLSDRGYITVRTTNDEDVLIIFIRARGIDEVELKIRRATTVAFSSAFPRLLIPNFSSVKNNS